jgi:hypothetical protein
MASRPEANHERPALTAAEALAVFDPALAGLDIGVDLIRAVVDPRPDRPPVLVTAREWPIALARLGFHRLIPQLASAARCGHVLLDETMSSTVDGIVAGITMQALQLEQLLVSVGDLLGREGIDFLVLKGLATSHLDFLHPEQRTAVDVDLLIRPEDLDRATLALTASGFDRPDEIRDLMDKGRTLKDKSGRHVDLHIRPHAPGRRLGSYWWETSDTFVLAGRTFSALSRGGRMAHAASHLALSWPSARRFSSALDLVVLVDHFQPADRVEAERFLADLAVEDIVNRITSLLSLVLGRTDVVVGARRRRPLDRLLRRAFDRADDDTAVMKIATIVGMPVRERLVVLRNWISPSSDYLERGGYASPVDRVLTVFRRFRGAGSDEP